MSNPLESLPEALKELSAGWAGHAAFGSFMLYLTGYLSLRFHLMSFGISSDLAVLDERYLFAGARFLVYLAAVIPSLLLVLLLPGALLWWGRRLIADERRRRLCDWCMAPQRLAWAGTVWAVAWTQFVMRQCWALSDLLLARQLPDLPDWLALVLLDEAWAPFYFMAVVGGCAVSALLLAALWRAPGSTAWSRGLLALLVGIQFLLLPVNYGVLVIDQRLPRVAAAGPRVLAGGESAWLVWEGKDTVSFLLRGPGDRRSLLTVERKQVPTLEIVGHDAILRLLLAAPPTTQGGGP